MRPHEDLLGRLFQAVGTASAKAAGTIPACLRNRKTGCPGSVVGDKVEGWGRQESDQGSIGHYRACLYDIGSMSPLTPVHTALSYSPQDALA